MKNYHGVIEAVGHCLRNDRVKKEAQHLLAFALLQTSQYDLAAAAFHRSVLAGNDTDWQPLVELFLDHPELTFTPSST